MAYILGPGTTTRAIARLLTDEKTLVGADVVCEGQLLAKDVTQTQLLNLTEAMLAGRNRGQFSRNKWKNNS